jgi:hypothetical protein
VDLYIHTPIRLHGVVLNELSTGTNLPYLNSPQFSMDVTASQIEPSEE